MSSILPFTFQKRLFFNLSLAFIVTSIVFMLWTLSIGWVLLSIYDHDPKMTFMGVIYGKLNSTGRRGQQMEAHNKFAIDHNQPFADQALFEELEESFKRERLITRICTAGSTMLIGTIGVILMWKNGKYYKKATELRPWQLFLILLSLFWMGLLVNNVVLVFFWERDKWLTNPYESLYSPLADIIMSLVAIFIFLIILFRFIPVRQRFTFMLAILVGVPLGLVLWLRVIGPVVLPVPWLN